MVTESKKPFVSYAVKLNCPKCSNNKYTVALTIENPETQKLKPVQEMFRITDNNNQSCFVIPQRKDGNLLMVTECTNCHWSQILEVKSTGNIKMIGTKNVKFSW